MVSFLKDLKLYSVTVNPGEHVLAVVMTKDKFEATKLLLQDFDLMVFEEDCGILHLLEGLFCRLFHLLLSSQNIIVTFSDTAFNVQIGV